VTGVGAGFLVVPLLALVDLSLVPAPVIFGSMALSLTMAFRGRHQIDFRWVPSIVVGIVPGSVFGAYLLTRVSPAHAGVVFGGLILLAVALSALGLRIPIRRNTGLAAGAVSGVLGSAAGIGGPVLALLYQHEPGERLRATLGLLYASASVLMLLILHTFGRFEAAEAAKGLLLAPGYLIGYALSLRLAGRLGPRSLRPAVLVLSAIAAVALLWRSG
jgi:uncharacterized membrane protein YfcA